MESFPLEPHPTKGPVHLTLYTNVTNAGDLRKRLLAADASLSFAFVDAKVVSLFNFKHSRIAYRLRQVVDKFQVLAAANKAVHDECHGHLTTHNVHSEIVYNLSPTTNVGFGIRK
ncbi:kinase binding protein CGI-121-domain-containing protein [Jimgerdemannia flammicorona]|uniref:EKC/KEOPS complex subunit CGI121 n=1 Tax=Jimgerdemannia flammicorona TaxID=994334 RepID=A0A433DDV7_9FUNG|nr:kinase binding protein CGI-121-domain-containing protein [Jimgerdemannia flammicorona]